MRGRDKVFRIRYRNGEAIHSRLVIGRKPDDALRRARVDGRILHVGKVGFQELFHVGNSNQMPQMLMREFRRKEDYRDKPSFVADS